MYAQVLCWVRDDAAALLLISVDTSPGDKPQMFTTGYAVWLHRDSWRRWGSAKVIHGENNRNSWETLQSSDLGLLWVFLLVKRDFLSSLLMCEGGVARSPLPRSCFARAESPSCGRCFPNGGSTMCRGKVTAQQVLSTQMCIQHICWELSGEREGTWLLLEGHFSQQKLVLTSQLLQAESVGCCLGHVSR